MTNNYFSICLNKTTLKSFSEKKTNTHLQTDFSTIWITCFVNKIHWRILFQRSFEEYPLENMLPTRFFAMHELLFSCIIIDNRIMKLLSKSEYEFPYFIPNTFLSKHVVAIFLLPTAQPNVSFVLHLLLF